LNNEELQQARQQLDASQQQNVPAEANPFERYNNVALPDTPISFGNSMAESLLNDNEVPEEIKKKNWHVFHKDNVLTFLDIDRKAIKMLNFDIMKIDQLNCVPYYDYNFELEFEMNKLRNIFETKLDRSLGTKEQGLKNERTVLQSQFSENRHISQMGDNSMIKEGFFKRLLGRRG